MFKLPLHLQFFADDDHKDSEAHTDGQGQAGSNSQGTTSSSDSSSSSSESTGQAAKYTQEDMNKAMANKDHEVTSKLKDSMKTDFSAAAQSMVASAISYGSKRAKMTDDQKSTADRKSSEAASKSMAQALASYKARDVHNTAVSNAQTALTSAGVSNPNSVAAFVADSDSEAQASKTSEFIDWYKAMADGVKKNALSPNTNPTNPGNSFTSQPNTTKKPEEMNATEYLKYRLEHRNQ